MSGLTDIEKRSLYLASLSSWVEATEKAVEHIITTRLTGVWDEGYAAGRSDAHPARYGDPPKYLTKNPYLAAAAAELLTRPHAVDAAAEAMWCREMDGDHAGWQSLYEDDKDLYREVARAALDGVTKVVT